jgi:hypothetical protein
LISSTKLWVNVGHPFPWPIRITWQGLSLLLESDTTHIRFPNGQEVSIEAPGQHLVEQDV